MSLKRQTEPFLFIRLLLFTGTGNFTAPKSMQKSNIAFDFLHRFRSLHISSSSNMYAISRILYSTFCIYFGVCSNKLFYPLCSSAKLFEHTHISLLNYPLRTCSGLLASEHSCLNLLPTFRDLLKIFGSQAEEVIYYTL